MEEVHRRTLRIPRWKTSKEALLSLGHGASKLAGSEAQLVFRIRKRGLDVTMTGEEFELSELVALDADASIEVDITNGQLDISFELGPLIGVKLAVSGPDPVLVEGTLSELRRRLQDGARFSQLEDASTLAMLGFFLAFVGFMLAIVIDHLLPLIIGSACGAVPFAYSCGVAILIPKFEIVKAGGRPAVSAVSERARRLAAGLLALVAAAVLGALADHYINKK